MRLFKLLAFVFFASTLVSVLGTGAHADTECSDITCAMTGNQWSQGHCATTLEPPGPTTCAGFEERCDQFCASRGGVDGEGSDCTEGDGGECWCNNYRRCGYGCDPNEPGCGSGGGGCGCYDGGYCSAEYSCCIECV